MKKPERRSRDWSIKGLIRKGFRPQSIGLEPEQAARHVLSILLKEKRRTIIRASLGAGGNTKHNRSVKRYANDRSRKLRKKYLVPRKLKQIDKSILTKKMMASPILESIDSNRNMDWRPLAARKFKTEFERVSFKKFNFLDFPSESINCILKLSEIEKRELNAYIDFEDQYCEDIGAYLVLAEFWHQLSPIFRGGVMSSSVQKVLNAVGLGRDLNISLSHGEDHKDVWAFPIRRRRKTNTTKDDDALLSPQARELLNDDLNKLINRWLDVASQHNETVPDDVCWELSMEGKGHLANMVGEILDNAERHSSSGADGDWSMAAFMAKRERVGQPDAMRCFLAFLSVGNSISQTLESAPDAVRNFCESYANGHRWAPQSRETLMTIAALQDGITSVHPAFEARRGGTGLQDMLNFIGDLGGHPSPDCEAGVTIVSGKSCIRLKSPNLVGILDGNGRRVHWCNEANDPIYPPDDQMAFDLPSHFAGTLVSVAFTLDPGLFSAYEDIHDG